ncbi:hypothetical protein CHU92_11685 [Flavobacterium cyanobacteriorum]|uniref:Uncharacterized protein n=1 Tax=Flavobacterium cyanobacteriorum TaxID=2022802 RepID=A0A255YYT6_9FLAO|nr:hypothetical protein [Flavobacterium cyanobacteriorum]OYQ34407.1 hypothetical protein CHU92_11685 [Flavobacterium cyanobacteriorum]
MDIVLKNVKKVHLPVLKSLAKALGFEISQAGINQAKIKSKGFDAKAFSGTVKFKGNPVEIQKEMRDEWE